MNDNLNKLLQDYAEYVAQIVIEKMAEKEEKEKPPRYYTRNEVSKILRISLPTLSRLTRDGLLHCKTAGKRVLYNAEEIDLAAQGNKSFKYRHKQI